VKHSNCKRDPQLNTKDIRKGSDWRTSGDATIIANNANSRQSIESVFLCFHNRLLSFYIQLGTDAGCHTDRARAAEHLLHAWGAVAAGLVGLAIELLAARAGAQDVVLVSEGVAELTVD
jgi:hypothetical protein